jgi:hypothetical protein
VIAFYHGTEGNLPKTNSVFNKIDVFKSTCV